eukprot:TRINITY_DN16085_c0_g1_i1.p1 TRINITY_DN16085_c0_g1~~TRINITY_DN16085_c0_g1_i1.p1  ORF type:complete len:554 (+),score=160.10 TRINITY_DN16085_c0_g1_i1:55-1716(+)
MAAASRKRAIVELARLRNILLHPEALRTLDSYVVQSGETNVAIIRQFIGEVLGAAASLGGGAQVTAEAVTSAIAGIRGAGQRPCDGGDRVKIVGLADLPWVEWDHVRGGFDHKPRPAELLALPQMHVRVALERLLLIRQRLHRSKFFTRKRRRDGSVDIDLSGQDGNKHPVCTLSSLEGTARGEAHMVLGRLTRGSDDKLYLEDDATCVRLECLPDMQRTKGLFHEGSMVVVYGRWEDDILHCEALGLPPSEERDASLAALPNAVDFFGLAPPPTQVRAAQHTLKHRTSQLVVFLAHVHADVPAALQRVTALMQGLDSPDCTPDELCVVLAGDFLSEPFVYGDTQSLHDRAYRQGQERKRFADALTKLADAVVAGSAEIAKKAQFVFVPGPGDPTPAHGVLPAHPIPEVFTAGVRRRLPNAVFATNPARLRFLSAEMVVFRDDVYAKLRRRCILPPLEEEYQDALCKTLADQAHLFPLPSDCVTVAPSLDPLLRLYPLPHFVVIADGQRAWNTEYHGCDFVSPGSFSRFGSFVVYRPSNGEATFERLRTAGEP